MRWKSLLTLWLFPDVYKRQGVDSSVEIWSKADWESYNESPELDSELIAEKMEGLGI